ncbi:DUF6858 family protein [Tepidibacillus fermentans]|uniref:Uncharacterized protein n=1 Tax=Tepidibacillus fermentans TaxID=1281767 RepID=A0A4R3KJ11_9BACI|nr:hypothetical protein [Tepidibacillus fermentans]TCS83536.1 hypothetical protein EDD72_10486 [Tepidibacillus fermentans]
MEKITFMENYSIYTKTILKANSTYQTVNEIMEHLKQKATAHPAAEFIAIYDHYQHTKNLENGEIAEGIIDAKNFIFCFGVRIPNPNTLALRPRSIGVVEYEDKFVLSFMEAPMENANKTMIEWVESIENK